MRRYTLAEEPMTLDDLVSGGAFHAVPIPALMVVPLLLPDAHPSGTQDEKIVVDLLGREEAGGRACRHIRVHMPGETVELWVADGPQPWLMRMRPIPPGPAPGDPAGDTDSGEDGMIVFSVQIDFIFRNWSTEFLSDEVFAIAPPADYQKVDELFPGMGSMGPEGEGPGGETEIRPAPDVALELLDGSSIELSSQRGKVVVLDFWATWCTPCLQTLPGLAAMIATMEEQDVVFFSIDRREDDKTVRDLLARREWDFPVAMDRDDSISRAFGVEPIPHTVIIDRQGRIRHEHIGAMPGLQKRLKREVEALVLEPAE
jgi:peroxiredoxin